MLVKLLTQYNMEIHGRTRSFSPGTIIRIKNKQLVAELVISGQVVIIGEKRPQREARLGLITLGPLLESVHRTVLPRYTTGPLIQAVHKAWFNNEPVTALGSKISRAQIQVYGGPDPTLGDCEVCQASEWLSRVTQTPQFQEHRCSIAEDCRVMCQRQGQEGWTHYHQNFWYALYVSQEANAPKCAMFQPQKGVVFISRRSCDPHTPVMLHQFAQACQSDVFTLQEEIEQSYDFAYTPCGGLTIPDTKKLPILMYGHDLWKRAENRQSIIDAVKPEYFWTPFPSSWKAHYKFPSKTKIIFRPVPTGMFFTRSNLDPEKKMWDLMSIGAMSNPIYRPRVDLRDRLALLEDQHHISFQHAGGSRRARWFGENKRLDTFYYSNAWSELLGTSRFVIFGPIAQEPQPVFFKYYECLGSGAIPIMPNAPDLVLLGIKPWEHFIPLEEMDTNEKIANLLDHYHEHFPIARRAVRWYENNADKLLFEGFEDLVQEITGGQYPRRLL